MQDQVLHSTNDSFIKLLDGTSQWLNEHGTAILLIIVIAWLAKKFGTKAISQLLNKTVRDDLYPTHEDRKRRIKTIQSITGAVLQIGVTAVAFIMILSELGVNTAPLIAGAGFLGVAFGIGAQSLIKDFSNGLFTIIDNQYRVGDYVSLSYGSNASVSGTVEAITMRTTALRSLNGTLHHIPNGNIIFTSNMTMGKGGMYEEITVGHDTDIAKVSMIIDTIGKNMKAHPEFASKIIEAPCFVRVDGFNADGVKIKVLCVTGPDDSWTVRGEFYQRLVKEFHKAKIIVPNTQELTIHQAKTPATKKPTAKKS